MTDLTFGEFVKRKRLETGQSLRAFCISNRCDFSNWSKMERGRLAPPLGEKLDAYAKLLRIKKGSADYYTLGDLAAAERGRVPPDLTEKEIAAKLPVFFRTLRDSAKGGGDDVDAMIDELKKRIRDA